MRDATQKEIEASRPDTRPLEAIQFCLDAFYADNEKSCTSEVCKNCTYEELLGALLIAKDEIVRSSKELKEIYDAEYEATQITSR